MRHCARACAFGLVLAAGCGHEAAPPAPLRLIDLFRPELVENRVEPVATSSPLEWRFGGSTGAGGWTAGSGVSGLAVRDGRLIGRATGSAPILAVEVPNLPQSDVIHEVGVRMRVSQGGDAAAILRGPEPVDFAFETERIREVPWMLTSPVLGGEMQTYALRGSGSVVTRGRRRLLLRPTDQPGGTFEIESVSLVTQDDHLRSVPSGVSWHGLSEVYRESLVARAPETIRYRVRLPRRPRLELAVGTTESWPVRFRVAAGAGGEEETLAERTVTVADRWEPVTIDLERFAGRDVTLSFGLSAEKPGRLGFWGSPVVRDVASGVRGREKENARGVILIWADALRRDHLDAYGHSRPTAPTVRRLASEGALFSDCVAQAPWTKASGPSILASLYPTTHGVTNIADRLPNSATTLAETFRDAGFATLGLISIPFVGRMTNLHQGFDEFHEPTSIPAREVSSKTARVLVDRLLPWIEAHRDVPFFVLLHVADAHPPFRPDPPYDTLWADAGHRGEHERQAAAVRPIIANPISRRFGSATRDELVKASVDPDAYAAYERDWYDGSIRGLDAELGRLRERLTELGLDDRVVMAFTSDHGYEFLEHGRMFVGQSVYGELTNVPLIVWGPATVRAGTVVNGTVQLIDVMPTLLDLAGVRPPSGIQGRSLAVALRGGPSAGRVPPRPAITEKHARRGTVGLGTSSDALFSDGWKLIQNTTRNPGTPEFELFDHRSDPLDRTDLAGSRPEVVSRLAKELVAWRAAATRARLKPDSAAAGALSKEELERLRSLGYIQ
jgi:arylsulfatase A-like enzyme